MTTTTLTDGWTFRHKAGVFSELAGSGTAAWQPVAVPHDAMIAETRRDDIPDGATSGHFPPGAYQYRRDFPEAVNLRREQVSLLFEGVYSRAAVYVNGALAGQRPSGYAEFAVRIDPLLRYDGTDELLVECRTGKDSRWYSGAGLYRPVHLMVKPRVHLDPAVLVRTIHVDHDLAAVEVTGSVVNDGSTTRTLRLRVAVEAEHGGSILASGSAPITVQPGDRSTVRQRLHLTRASLWSPDSPALHRATLVLDDEHGAPLDTESTTFGIRTVTVDPQRGLRINGQEVLLRGACIHHDNGVIGAATFAAAEQRRVRILKEAGFNAVRAAHNPLSRALLDACDRAGVLVMDEAFDMWTTSKTDEDYSGDFPEWWERDIESMVAKDVNHPSVVFYSIGNEIPEAGSPSGARLSRQLAEKVRALDPTRLVTNGINGFVSILDEVLAGMRAQSDAGGSGGVNTMMAQLGDTMNAIAVSESVTTRTEESQAVLDVAGMNYAEARYAMDADLFPNRVIVGTESFPTRIAEIWTLVEALPHVIGDFTWTGWDYLGEAGIGGIDHVDADADVQPAIARAYPWLLAFCGDIDITGHRRPASYYREIVYGLRTDPYIAVQRPEHHGQDIAFATPWAWSDSVSSWAWVGSENRPVHVEVYARADEVALLLDGRELDRQPVGSVKPFRADFETEVRAGRLEAVAYRDGAEIGRHQLSGAAGGRRLNLDVDHRPGAELAFITISVVDGAGTVLTGQDVLVAVELEGPGFLQGFGSARPSTWEAFTSTAHTTFDGRALAVVRLSGHGTVRMTVSADGLDPQEVKISI